MKKVDFNNKKFALLENSQNGEVNPDTIFEYKQDDNLVTATYHGGPVRYGTIIAHLNGADMEMIYQCLTNDNELKAGKATAKVSITDNNKIKLDLDWEWLHLLISIGQKLVNFL